MGSYGWCLSLSFWCLAAIAQNQNAFQTIGAMVRQADCAIVHFRPDLQHQGTFASVSANAAVWYHKPLDLRQPFDLGFRISVDNMSAPGYQNIVDGFALVLKRPGAPAVGSIGSGMGFGGLTPSLAVAFDMKAEIGVPEPNFPHLSIHRNGNVQHNSSNLLAGDYDLTPFILNVTQPGLPFPPRYAMKMLCKVT